MVGANAPPTMAPIAYEIETPENRMDAGNSSEYRAAYGP
jgi:galactokinase/mevalonate kinase-like predicted kinase